MIHRWTDPEKFFFFFGSMRRCERRRETRVVLMSESRTKLGPSLCTFSPICSFGFRNGTHDVRWTAGPMYCEHDHG